MRCKSVITAALFLLSIAPAGATEGDAGLPLFSAFPAFGKFVDDLPIPPRILVKDESEITITLQQISAKPHRDLPEGPFFAYNGSVPGPTIEVESGHPLRVHWKNELPAKHIFPVPAHAMGTDLPDVRNVTHLHGAVVEQPNTTDKLHNNDGWPDLFTVPGEEQIADYPNSQDARILWYHDHAISTTGRNVAAGLAGMYLIHDDFERSLNLPSGDYDIPLIFMAPGMNGDGTRNYSLDIQKEFYGNAPMVNGKLFPRLTVEPRKYRFRMLDGSNARTFSLKLIDLKTNADGPAIVQIASDAGFLEHPVALAEPANPKSPRLVLGPGERADVVIDFSAFAGQDLFLSNDSLDPGDGEMPLPQIMLFHVGTSVKAPDTSSLPANLKPVPRIDPAEAKNTRRIVLGAMNMADGSQMLQLNGKSWTDAITEQPLLGSTEIWEIVDTLPDTHPFHVHLVQFQVLDRRPFDTKAFADTGELKYLGDPIAPEANEMGWKDIVRAGPGTVTRIIMRFLPYAGYYVYHCHILEHEDMDMMRPFQVVKP
jgi:spore coat protein A, manganese oxidase